MTARLITQLDNWTSSVRRGTAARALAALGVMHAELQARGLPDRDPAWENPGEILEAALDRRTAQRWPTIPWEIPANVAPRLLRQADPRALAKAWTTFIQEREWTLRLAAQSQTLDLATCQWLHRRLVHESAAAGIFFALPTLGTADEWSWPLRLGVLPDPRSRELARRLTQQWSRGWRGEMTAISELTGPEVECDLLIVPDSLSNAVQHLDATPNGLSAGVILVLRGLGPADAMTPDELGLALRESLDPWAICVADVSSRLTTTWLSTLLWQLSHDDPLDLALARMPARLAAKLDLLVANPAPLTAQHVSAVAERIVDTLATANGGEMLALPQAVTARFDMSPGLHARAALVAAIRKPLNFRRELDGATGTLHLARMPRTEPRRQARWLQAQIHDPQARTKGPIRGALSERHTYDLSARVGPEEVDWIRGKQAFPDRDLPRDEKRHLLRVVFQPVGSRAKPVVGHIHLPPSGPSEVCRFRFRTAKPGSWRGRLILQFRNRVLQTAVISAPVIAAGAVDSSGDGARLRIEAVVRAPSAPLSGRAGFSGSFVHNHDPDGTPSAAAFAGDWVKPLRVRDVDRQATQIGLLLSRVANDPDSYGKLTDQATIDLLYGLALQGSDLYTGLFQRNPPPSLARGEQTRRIQVVAADPNAFFPLEFVYEFPPPSQASLCPNAVKALQRGECDAQRFHAPVARDGSIPMVCPVGFLSMSAVIERYAADASVPDLVGFDYGLRSDPYEGRDELGGTAPTLVAFSDRVKRQRARTVIRAIAAATESPALQVETWEDWVEQVADAKPSMLMLLSHTTRDERALQTALEIAADQACPAGRFTPQFVRADGIDPGPLVLLLGCETALPWLEYQNFVVRFRNLGAALVVGTVATVPSSHAANVAAMLVRALAMQARPGSSRRRKARVFGDALLAARRRMLARGEVMALCLTAYGDAQWRFPE